MKLIPLFPQARIADRETRRRRLDALLPLLLMFCSSSVVLAQAPSDPPLAAGTREVTDRYLELTFNQQYDALLDLYTEDAVFFDPTGDVFKPDQPHEPTVGGARIVALQKSWGIESTDFDIDAAFTVGEYSLYRGTLNTRFRGSDRTIAIPLVMVLRVVNGRIAQRMDIGEYIESFGLGNRFDAATAETRAVADRYLRAYLDADLDAQRNELDASVRFQDQTAQLFGPPSGQLIEGADTLLKRRAITFANVSDFDLDVSDSFVSWHHAVYIGTTTYTVGSGASYAQPAVFVIEVRDGKVTRHWDFVDYTVR